jgi:internalin A
VSLAQLAHLHTLHSGKCPWNPELAAASEQGLDAVKAYLRAQAEEKIVLNEAKLILIGEGEVGKSCLLDALRDEPFHKRPSTHGIEIKPVRVTHSGIDGSETEISLNTWDFGGQKVYRQTHQMFFTAPAVYLVVWKPREGPQQGAVEFWIETILSRAGNDVRILVIATHGGPGQRLPDLAQQELRDRFGNSIVGFLSVDSQPEGYDKDDESTWDGPRKGIEELKSRIAEIAAGLPAMGREVPASWKSVLTALQERGKDTPWIKYKDFQNLCRPRKVSHELAATYAGMLKTLGYIIHYGQDGEDNDQGLGQYMILRPDYLAKAISFVLDDQTTRDQHGLITHERLSSLWSDPPYNYEFGYPEEIHELFRKLMEQFDLSYEVAHDPAAQDPKPTSLIAQLVDENPPKLPDWSDIPLEAEDEKKQICQIVEKDGDKSASAEGLFYRLIARLHRYSLGKANHDLSVHWQYGLMLEDAHNGRALLRHIGNDIHITVRGAYPEFMLYELTREVRWLVENPDEGWKGLRCDIMVPCVEPCGLKEPGRGLFEVGALKESRLEGRPEYPCDAVIDGQRCKKWQPIDCLLQNSTSTRAPSPQLSDLDVVKIRDAIMEKVRDELREQIHGKDHKDLLRFRELHKLMSQADEQFAILMQMLVDEGREGPRLFSLTPEDTGFLDNPGWATQKFRLTLWCEHSRLPLPVLWKDENAGVYRLEKPRDWLRKYGPALRIVSRTLGAVLPVVNATTKVVLGAETVNEISADLDLGRELFKLTLTGIDEVTSISGGPEIDEPDHGYPREAYGASFRELQTMLKKQDAGLGGLVRVLNKRREVVWVHPDFVDEARQR